MGTRVLHYETMKLMSKKLSYNAQRLLKKFSR